MNIAIQSTLKARARAMLSPATRVPKRKLAAERTLSVKKWFDYSWLSPFEATELFSEACIRAYVANWCIRWKRVEEKPSGGLRLAGIEYSPEDFTALWNARQLADGMGIPYDFFMRHLYEISNRRRGKLRPNRGEIIPLHWTYPLYDGLRARWYKHRRDVRTMVSYLPQYRTESFRGLPAQIAHREWVMEQIELRGNVPDHIGRFVFTERLLPMQMAIMRFGETAVRRGEAEVGSSEPAELAESSENSFWPACYVMPHAIDLTTTCSKCPMAKRCNIGESAVRNALLGLYGTDNPGVTVTFPPRVETQRRRSRAERFSYSKHVI